MKKEVYSFPKSSFLSVEKDLNLIVNQILKNENLKKMLFYTSPDALSKPPVKDEDAIGMFGKNIKIIPKLTVDGSLMNYMIVTFDNFTETSNPEFRDNIVEFDIICHFNQWQMNDLKLRPYRIAAELDTLFNNKHLTGIGTLEFLGANQIVLTDEFAGLCLMYRAVHGEDDKKFALKPSDDLINAENFNKIFNTEE